MKSKEFILITLKNRMNQFKNNETIFLKIKSIIFVILDNWC